MMGHRLRFLILLAMGLLVAAGVGVGLSIQSHQITAAPESEEHEPLVYHGVTACGVERWFVKTGIDGDARKVNTKSVVNDTIFHLRSLPSPASIPARNRIAPTEDTVFHIAGFLLRIKQEADSDFHLVIADSGGRTMITEAPAPQCTGSNSPFLPQIRYVRRVLISRFHPTDVWERGHWPVQVTGVGFFDFKHGQSGGAPNAIELHPILGVKIGSLGSAPPPSRPKPTSPPKPPPSSGAFTVSAYVSPNPVSYGQYATLYAGSLAGAACTAAVIYSTGRSPVSFSGTAQTVGGSGTVGWQWHMESKGSSGTGTVTCSYKGASKSATASFIIG
jgi:hypothetical protein